MHTHVSNFYAPECGFEFDKALLASSSELLVKRHCPSDYVSGFSTSAQAEVYDNTTD